MTLTIEVDARGLRCPLPVLRARKALEELGPGGLLRLWADDAVAVIDVPLFCRDAGHEFLAMEEHEGAQLYLIRRG
ncbi:tRNA 2-thiouridine synthesizing protein A [Rhodovulum sp. ES.010]|uniref:sulfurtransferase TusA family protein n=1 Tax=Rhodovulum sp. ES.010 TaxID=1882821 RepID=UPI00092AFFC4|nr:sulfurtransferase TusA family protein [Rhodovulum sp. ES.010]SIO26591.1 tRNA 2-thiouridine synthesizing protein A [Rhodovulum sp. ES.010]